MSDTKINQSQSIKGDRALGGGDDDRLGFRDVAERIAISLVDRATEDGLVVGLEGPWGSGKSSLLFLIDDELGKMPQERRPTIINFRPWLVGNRDALIYSLFEDLLHKIDEVALRAGDAAGINLAKAKEAGDALRGFIGRLSKAGGMIKFFGKASGVGPIELIGEGVESLSKAAEGDATSPSLSELKDKLSKSLRDLQHRFVVTIDDVDRLEPSEAIEVLRLVRSVVDLPNMIYILCYDSAILAHSIEKAAGVKSGQDYLEKIVQLTVMVPKPEALQLRQWFSDELHTIASAKNEDERSRLEAVIDHEGGRQLRTPRSVVRALDAIRFFWPPLFEIKADIADLVWIQLIKDGNANLYRWIEDYCATAAVLSLGIGRIDDAERQIQLAKLVSTVGETYFDNTMYRFYFSEQLPGIEPSFSKEGDRLKIFCSVSDAERDNAIQCRRLASPDHYRLYFALANPSHVLKQEELASVWAAAESSAELVGNRLLSLHTIAASGTLTKADMLLERVKGGVYEALSQNQCKNMVLAFSLVMDQAYKYHPFDLFWINNLWSRAQDLVPILLSRLEPLERETVIVSIFEQGPAVGWLTWLFRHEVFSHGRQGDRRRPEDEWIFTDNDLDKITSLMLDRYKKITIKDLLSSPHPISMLFAWQQAGDDEGPRRLIAEAIKSDHGLVEVLERMVSDTNGSSKGKIKVIHSSNINPFMDAAVIRGRIEALTSHADLGERAMRLTINFKDGDRF
ncbi:KAP family NTPase [Methylobacterium currus]|uniref:KAP family P-loop NTPase fold protein n=1 Tax=Methylobacterium currus TaxID=2051553 RepID=UPI001E4CB85D|nr:P-loop NTPase fold protein [Methylobacterium currus]UHC17311.1 KAP family NTPase [Methylobacterium currus]